MKEGWTYKKLGEVCEILDSRRKPIAKSKRETGTIPYYGASGLLDYVKDYIFDERLVLLGEDGAKWGSGENSSYIIEGKSWVNNHAHALKPKRDILVDELLVYYLNFSNLLPYITGVTVPKLNQEKMCSIEIPIGPIDDQLSIVSRLDAAFAHIDALKANAEKQLAEARQLFQAELTECMRPKEGWEEKKLGEVCEVISGQSPEGKFYNTEGNGTPFYQGKKDFTLKYVGTPTMWTTEVTKLAEKDDILMSVRAPVGDVNFATQKICIGRGLAAIRTKRTIDKGYLFYYLVAKKSSIKGKEGVGFASINRKEIMDIDIQFPNDISEQRQIVSRLDALSANIKKLEEVHRKTLAECDALKQAMLREVFE